MCYEKRVSHGAETSPGPCVFFQHCLAEQILQLNGAWLMVYRTFYDSCVCSSPGWRIQSSLRGVWTHCPCADEHSAPLEAGLRGAGDRNVVFCGCCSLGIDTPEGKSRAKTSTGKWGAVEERVRTVTVLHKPYRFTQLKWAQWSETWKTSSCLFFKKKNGY